MTPVSSVPVRLRRDVRAERIELGMNADWVIQDPLTRNFFYFSDAEYCILKLLDGTRSWGELLRDVSRRVAPQRIDFDSLAGFVADAKSKGLVEEVERRSGTLGVLPNRIAASVALEHAWWHQPLAIRLPGIYPDRWLERLFGRDSWIRKHGFSGSTFGVCVAFLWLVAMLVAVSHIDSLVVELDLLSKNPPPQQILLLVICIGLMKVFHEVGHAIACKMLGGECREIGVMFLMGVPCLYCDVSDSWMMPNRWKRMLISAAGMIVELTLAALAVIGWAVMAPGPWRDAAMMVMVIGSVNTVLINGNPLLRYDGYFIFSDWVRVPNLGYEAIEALRHSIRRIVWGRSSTDGEVAGDQTTVASTRFLVCYALLSAIYRYVMLTAIVYAIYRITAGQGLAWLSIAIGIVIFGRNQYGWWKSIGKVPVSDETRSSARFRWIAIRLVILSVLAWLWFTPFSRSLTVPVEIRPAEQQELYVTVPGRIVSTVAGGTPVRKGDVVMQLANEEAERSRVTLETERRELVAKATTFKLRQSVQRNVSAEIAAIESAIEALDQRLQWQSQQIERLAIRAPADGVVYEPVGMPLSRSESIDGEAAETWSGSPLASENRGAWLNVGTLVAIVGHAQNREAIAVVDQSQIDWIRPGHSVKLLRSDFEKKSRQGTVRDVTFVGAMEEPDVPLQGLQRGDSLRRDTSARKYRVLVEMLANDWMSAEESPPSLPVRSAGLAKLSVEPMSFHQRTRQLLNQMFAAP